MRSVLRTALLWAVPVEVFNFWVIGYPAGEHSFASYSQSAALALEWYVLHLPGVVIIDHSSFLRLHPWAFSLVFFVCGFMDTALVLLLALWVVGRLKLLLRRLSSKKRSAVEPETPRSTRLSA